MRVGEMARVVIGKRLIEGPAILASAIQALGLLVIDNGAPTSSDLWPTRRVDDSLSDRRAIHRLLPVPSPIGDSVGNDRLKR